MAEATLIPVSPALKQAAQLALYRQDFPRFAAEQLKITREDIGFGPFLLRPFQQRVYARWDAQRRARGWIRQLVLKGRQVGSSTLAQGLIFWRTVLNPYTNAMVVAHDAPAAETIFQMAKRFYENMDAWLQPMVRYDTKDMLMFDAKPGEKGKLKGLQSRITVASAKNFHSGAGSTLHCVHLSEAGRYQNAVEISSGALNAVSLQPGTVVIIESTARPEGDWFRMMCDAAREGKSHYEFTFVPWTDDPKLRSPLEAGEVLELDAEEIDLMERFRVSVEQLKWRRMKIAEKLGDLDEFNMDYPITYDEAWITREFMVFPRPQLALLHRGVTPPRFTGSVHPGKGVARAVDGPLAVWEEPQAGAMYDIGVDVATGHGRDYSVAEVLKRPYGVQVAEYRAKIEPGEFNDVLDALGRWYNTAQIAVETNQVGYYTNSELGKNYPNLYIWRRKDKLKNQLSTFFGWETNTKTKRWLVSLAKDRVFRYAEAFAQLNYPLVRSQQLWRELSVFVQDPGTEDYHAAPGEYNYDDCAMAWMIAMNAGHDELGIEFEREAAPDAPQPLEFKDPARWMDEQETGMLRGSAFESDAWDVRGYARR